MKQAFTCLTIPLLMQLTTFSPAAEIEPTWESMAENYQGPRLVSGRKGRSLDALGNSFGHR